MTVNNEDLHESLLTMKTLFIYICGTETEKHHNTQDINSMMSFRKKVIEKKTQKGQLQKFN